MDEFALIRRYFSAIGSGDGVHLGVGDDAAVLEVPSGDLLVTATDTLVAGVHFPLDEPAAAVGYRAVAVNVSDFAAMATRPRWFTLALTLPNADSEWLQSFSAGLRDAALVNDITLVGGDTTRGPLTISLTVLGCAPTESIRRRDGAKAGDTLLVSGPLGDAAGGLRLLETGTVDTGAERHLVERFRRPPSRWRLAVRAAPQLHAAIDVSDGLLADLAHLATASGVAAEVDAGRLPCSDELLERFGEGDALRFALTGGDDYELLVAAPASAVAELETLGFIAIGRFALGEGVHVSGGPDLGLADSGYRHFRDAAS
ncbi:MAG: thiamine-phosphate kinase [Pseudomonadota bacterium]